MITVVVPAYNAAEYLDECLSGIRGQSYTDIEAIIVDDGSTDATSEIARRHCLEDERLSLISTQRGGAGVARNAGLDKARGEYVLFFDTDDRMPAHMLQSLVERAEQTQADVCCCRSRTFIDGQEGFVDANDGPHVEDFSQVYAGVEFGDLLLSHFVGWPWDKLFRTAFVREHGLRFQGLSSTNDAFFVYCALALAKRIALVDEALPEHRKHSGSIEQVRWKSPHNVRLAYEALVERLSGEPEWEQVGDSVHLWGLRHMRWNFLNLPHVAQGEAFDDYLWCLDRLLESGIVLDDEDMRIHEAHEAGRASRMDVALAEQSLEMRERELAWDGERTALEADIAGLRYALDHVMGSASFKVGRVMTAPMRLVRDLVRERSSSSRASV